MAPDTSTSLGKTNGHRRQRGNVCLLVLGDIGRSPRMQYHALSLANTGFHVDFVGYKGADPLETITSSPFITLRYIKTPWSLPHGLPKVCFAAYAPLKVLFQLMQLFWVLLSVVKTPDFLLVQNPPSIPTLFVARVVCFLLGCRLVIDWHNMGYSILALKMGKKHSMVKIAKRFEFEYGRKAYAHLCVTKAMADRLKQWGVRGRIVTLYDRAPDHFCRLSLDETHELLLRLQEQGTFPQNPFDSEMQTSSVDETLFTRRNRNSCIVHKTDRPALIISSTSWTEDEDFSLLIDAANLYDVEAQKRENDPNRRNKRFHDRVPSSGKNVPPLLPRLLFVITGKGPLKEFYEEKIRGLSLKYVRIVTTWLAMEDYPRLLGTADLGISLHKSSSGLDLPMKVVDMFGCELPVCAVDFQCLSELVRDGQNGLVFHTGNDLADNLITLFSDFSGTQDSTSSESTLARLRRGTLDFRNVSWTAHWDQVAGPVFLDFKEPRREK